MGLHFFSVMLDNFVLNNNLLALQLFSTLSTKDNDNSNQTNRLRFRTAKTLRMVSFNRLFVCMVGGPP